MLFNTVRFASFGWIDDHFVQPQFHFAYFGFEWVQPLPAWGMYAVHIAMGLAALAILLGWYYRWAAAAFFVLFTYCELIDLTYYLNHYYFISLVSLLMIFLPAHHRFSLDAWQGRVAERMTLPRWCTDVLKLQIGLVYFYAGVAKINADWLLEAMPLRLWLPANDTMPVLGTLFTYPETAYVFSWAGMLFDTTIVFFLLVRATRPFAYAILVFFHGVTAYLFQIGVFPLVMSLLVWIFFSERFHETVLRILRSAVTRVASMGLFRPSALALLSLLRKPVPLPAPSPVPMETQARTKRSWLIPALFIPFFVFQILFPWRYLVYPGNLFWAEEGYRFSWRVMLMEKAGTAQFFVKDSETGREGEVWNREFLNAHQEKQMSFQPDMILQFAHFLAEYYEAQGMHAPQVRCEAWVTLNGRPSQLLIDPDLDLTTVQDGWRPKTWIRPFDS